jgi:hypothetical protein
MTCRVEGHIHDTFKREHPIRHSVSVEIRVCFRCYEIEAGPVGTVFYESAVPLEAFRGNSGFVVVQKGRGVKAHVMGSQKAGYAGSGYARLYSLCGGMNISARDLAEANKPDDEAGFEATKIDLEGSLDDVSCGNCVKTLARDWERALAGDMELAGCRALIRRVTFGHGMASIPKCECLHGVHVGNCPSGTCKCMVQTCGCSGQGCHFIGPRPSDLHGAITQPDAPVEPPWGHLGKQAGIYCPTCVAAANF